MADAENHLPEGWIRFQPEPDGYGAEGPGPLVRRLRLMWSDDYRSDGRLWRTVMVGVVPFPEYGYGSPELATPREMDWVRRLVIGAEREAYQVYFSDTRAVQTEPPDLVHWLWVQLYACMDGNGKMIPPKRRDTPHSDLIE